MTQKGAARGFEGIVIMWLQARNDGVTVERRGLDLTPTKMWVKGAEVSVCFAMFVTQQVRRLHESMLCEHATVCSW
jgi:hypothetical protein